MKHTQGNSEWLRSEGLALVDRVDCDTKGCNNEAKFYARSKCCYNVLLACSKCMQKAYADLLEGARNGQEVECIACNEYSPAQNFLGKPSRLTEAN